MLNSSGEYINGYIERNREGRYDGELSIEGVDISPITAVTFIDDGKNYMWLRRKDKLVYDGESMRYISVKREPRWEAYLEKQNGSNAIAYKGEFPFLRFRFSIIGMWDAVLGKDKNRMNFFIERLPMENQDIINGINKRKLAK